MLKLIAAIGVVVLAFTTQASATAPAACPPGQSLNSSGRCQAEACPAGTVRSSTGGACVASGPCPQGQYLLPNMSCTRQCPPGTSPDEFGACAQASCPTGMMRKTAGAQCVAKEDDAHVVVRPN